MAILDFEASMKQDKKIFDENTKSLVNNALKKQKRYTALFNNANRLKNEIKPLLARIEQFCYEQSIPLIKPIREFNFIDLENLIIESKLTGIHKEALEVYIFKVKKRIDEINKLRTEMIQIDLYDAQANDMEDNTLSEEYIDMDKLREERGINPLDELNGAIDRINFESLLDDNGDFYTYICDGKADLKTIATQIYGNPSYWVYIFNYGENAANIKKIAVENLVTIDEVVTSKELLVGLNIKLPKELDFYSEEFNTSVLKKVA